MGVLMMTLEASHAQAASAGGVLTLLERALASVPAALLSSKGPRMAGVIVAVSNLHVDQPQVVRPALSCARRLLLSLPPRSADATKLWRWLLEFVAHSHPKVRQRGQATATEVLREAAAAADSPAAAARRAHLSSVAAAHVEARLSSPSLKDLQPILFLLHFLHSAIGLLAPAEAAAVAAAVLKLPSLGHPLITSSALDLLHTAAAPAEASTGDGATSPSCALPAPALGVVIQGLLAAADAAGSSAKAGAVEGPALRAALSAATSLCAADPSAGGSHLAPLASAMLEALLHAHVGTQAPSRPAGRGKGGGKGGRGCGKGGRGGAGDEPAPPATLGVLEPRHLSVLVTGCVDTKTDAPAAAALAAALADGLAPRYLPLWRPVLEACGELFSALGERATPAADRLLRTMGGLYSDHKRLGEARGTLMASIGLAARAIGPQEFVGLLPIRVSTSVDGEDTSWLLTVLRGHCGSRATLGFFSSYFMPLQAWLLNRAAELATEARHVEQKNLHNLFEQVRVSRAGGDTFPTRSQPPPVHPSLPLTTRGLRCGRCFPDFAHRLPTPRPPSQAWPRRSARRCRSGPSCGRPSCRAWWRSSCGSARCARWSLATAAGSTWCSLQLPPPRSRPSAPTPRTSCRCSSTCIRRSRPSGASRSRRPSPPTPRPRRRPCWPASSSRSCGSCSRRRQIPTGRRWDRPRTAQHARRTRAWRRLACPFRPPCPPLPTPLARLLGTDETSHDGHPSHFFGEADARV